MTTKMLKFDIQNVQTFQGFNIEGGEVSVNDGEYLDFLNGIYETVTVCGMEYEQGNILEAVDPVAFRCSRGDYESQLQSELESQLEDRDDSGIEFIDDDLEEEGEE